MGKSILETPDDSTETRWHTNPVGLSGPQLSSAMLIEKQLVKDKSTGKEREEYCFVEEIEFWHTSRIRNLENAHKLFSFSRWEMWFDKEDPRVSPNHHMIISRYPHSNGFAGMVKLRKPRRDLGKKRTEKIDSCHTQEELLTVLDSFDVDYWQTQGLWVAGISRGSTEEIDKQNWNDSKEHLHGLCKNAENVYWELRYDPRAKKLLKATYDESLLRKAVNKRLPVYSLPPEVIVKAEHWMDLAVRQAMAGPDKSEVWIGKPVQVWIKYLYERHIYRHWNMLYMRTITTIKKKFKKPKKSGVKTTVDVDVPDDFLGKLWVFLNKMRPAFRKALADAGTMEQFESAIFSLDIEKTFDDIVMGNNAGEFHRLWTTLEIVCTAFEESTEENIDITSIRDHIKTYITPEMLDDHDEEEFLLHKHELIDPESNKSYEW